MFNYNVNWDKIIKQNLPLFLHILFRLDWIRSLIKPFKIIYNDFLIVKQEYIYKVRFTGQICYLKTILNQKFDPINNGIYITSTGPSGKYYIYRRSELKPPMYLYSRWQPLVSYAIGVYVVEGHYVYGPSTNTNVGIQPSLYPGIWPIHKKIDFLRRRSEFNLQYDFEINIPATLVYNSLHLRAVVDYYKLAGKRYQIVLY